MANEENKEVVDEVDMEHGDMNQNGRIDLNDIISLLKLYLNN